MNRLRILVVEDDPDWREALEEILEEAKYSVTTVASFDEAQNIIQKGKGQRFGAIIVDLDLQHSIFPEGIEFLRMLQWIANTTPSKFQVPAFVVSQHKKWEDDAIMRGAREFFYKSDFSENKKEFLSSLEKAVDESRKHFASEDEYAKLTERFNKGKTIKYLILDNEQNPWANLIRGDDSA